MLHTAISLRNKEALECLREGRREHRQAVYPKSRADIEDMLLSIGSEVMLNTSPDKHWDSEHPSHRHFDELSIELGNRFDYVGVCAAELVAIDEKIVVRCRLATSAGLQSYTPSLRIAQLVAVRNSVISEPRVVPSEQPKVHRSEAMKRQRR